MQNLTQRLPWGGRRGKKLAEINSRFFTSRCIYSCEGAFTFLCFPRDMMAGRAPEIQAERERKLKEAREQRKLANRQRGVP